MGSEAMASSSKLGLDNPFSSMVLGSSVTVVANVLYHSPGAVVCQTTINNQEFLTDAKLTKGSTTITLLDFRISQISGRTWLLAESRSKVLMHQQFSPEGILQLVEGCSGLGAVGKGFHFLGLHSIAFVESNEKFATWLQQQGHSNVFHGDIANTEIIHKVGKCCEAGPPTVTAGVSCQPFSYLGDRRESSDPRSESMPSAIRLGFLLNSPLIILECTPGAKDSEWVQCLLREFALATSYRVDQVVLELHHLWPTHRNRWWAILSHPMFRLQSIPKMPTVGWEPSILHLIPGFLKLSALEIEQLELTPYELRLFHANVKGIASSIVNSAKSMPTATHSWGSQLLPCACGCRKGGFTTERLEKKGSYGVLIPLGKEITLDGVELSCMRHPHPEEIALLNGLDPRHVQNLQSKELRLLLAGVGQLGSPLQSGWIMGNILKQLQLTHHWPGDSIDPNQIIRNMCLDLLQARDERWGDIKSTKYMTIFRNALHQLGTGKGLRHLKEDTFDFTQAMLEKVKEVEKEKQAEIGKTENPPESPNIPMPIFDRKHPREVPQQRLDQTMLDSEDRCQPREFRPDPHVLDRWCEKEGTPGGSIEKVNGQVQQVYTLTGGIASFSTKRPFEAYKEEEQEERKAKVNKEQKEEIKTEDVAPTAVWTQPAIGTTEETHTEEELTSGHIWIGHENQSLQKVSFKGSPTIGQATQAEAKLLGLSQHQSSLTAMGSCQSIAKEIAHEQVLLIRPIGTFNKNECKRVHMQAAICENQLPPDLHHLNRLDALWHQMGWVALDEMTFYLAKVMEHFKVMTSIPVILDKIEPHLIWGKWILQASEIAAAANQSYKVSTVCLHDHHWFPLRIEVMEGSIVITTTPIDSDFIHDLSKKAFGNYDFVIQTFDIHHKFPVDCGYQSIAWIISLHSEQTNQAWFEEEQALQWKQIFSQHLIEHGVADQPCIGIKLGGMNPNLVFGDLQKLLEQHGVKSQRSSTHAQHIISKLGLQAVIQTLQAPRPWQDLKAKANATTPSIQLVQSDELKQMIDNRLKNGKTMGSKQTKEGPSAQKRAPVTFRLNPSQIQVPAGIFQQTDGTKLQQLTIMQVQQNAQGFAVVSADEARPFYELQEPITKFGLGLLILDGQQSDVHAKCEKIRFPAQFSDTDEPVIVTAALLQLGQQSVIRHKPDSCTKIEEISTTVLRVLVYRDLYQQHDWQHFQSRPVKCLMEHEPFVQLSSTAIIDVWDRQFLSKTFKKSKANEADMFLVTMRVEEKQGQDILNMSGNAGIFR